MCKELEKKMKKGQKWIRNEKWRRKFIEKDDEEKRRGKKCKELGGKKIKGLNEPQK